MDNWSLIFLMNDRGSVFKCPYVKCSEMTSSVWVELVFVLQAVSAFAPICNPMQCPWGQKAFSGYLGSDRSTWEVRTPRSWWWQHYTLSFSPRLITWLLSVFRCTMPLCWRGRTPDLSSTSSSIKAVTTSSCRPASCCPTTWSPSAPRRRSPLSSDCSRSVPLTLSK